MFVAHVRIADFMVRMWCYEVFRRAFGSSTTTISGRCVGFSGPLDMLSIFLQHSLVLARANYSDFTRSRVVLFHFHRLSSAYRRICHCYARRSASLLRVRTF